MTHAPTPGLALPGLQGQAAGWVVGKEGPWKAMHALTLPTSQMMSASWELALSDISFTTF